MDNIKDKYDYIGEFHQGVAIIIKNDKYGAVMVDGKEILPPIYDNINPTTNGFLQLLEKGSWYGKTDYKLGISNKSGDILVPVLFSEVCQLNVNDNIFWIVSKKIEKEGLYSPYLIIKKGVYCNGKIIVPVIFDEITFNDNMFECVYKEEKDFETITKYNIKGEVVLRDNFFVPSEYSLALESTIGLFRVMKNGKWGIMNQKKKLIVSNVYAYIHDFKGCYAIVEKGEYISYFGEGLLDYETNKLIGLIDTTGEEVLAIEYEHLWQYDNGCILAKKEGLYGVLSPSLTWCITPRFHNISILDNNHYVASIDGREILIDFLGNEIQIVFDEIKPFIDGYFKVISYRRGTYVGIINAKGKIIINNDYDSIQYIGNGLILTSAEECVESHRGIGERYKTVYSLFNMQGIEILSTYDKIDFLSETLLAIKYDKKWGLADVFGNIIVEPVYINELDFKLGVSPVSIDASPYSQRINIKGEIIVVDENTGDEVTLSKEYYWGTNFINGLCIVRSCCQHVGVIGLNGEIIIPTQYKVIHILSNDVIVAKNDEDNWGVFNDNGNIIMDFIYDLIEPQENSFYAIVKKGQTYGIANLETDEIVLFEQLKIKHMWNLDKYGRCLYSENCVFDWGYKTWEGGTTGLIDMNGIIIPSGEYEDIYSLNEDIVTAICENGKEEFYEKYEDENGKWWINNNDEVIKVDENYSNNSLNETSVIILSDEIPKSYSNGHSSWYYHNDSYDDCGSRYGGYNGYDDDTIDSAFEGDPELTWNID